MARPRGAPLRGHRPRRRRRLGLRHGDGPVAALRVRRPDRRLAAGHPRHRRSSSWRNGCSAPSPASTRAGGSWGPSRRSSASSPASPASVSCSSRRRDLERRARCRSWSSPRRRRSCSPPPPGTPGGCRSSTGPGRPTTPTPILVFGAGEGGRAGHHRDAARPRQPVPARSPSLDDDPRKRNLRIRGRAGAWAAAADVARDRRRALGAERARSSPSRRADGRARPRARRARPTSAGLRGRWPSRRSPSCSTAAVGVGDIRPLTTADLLGRREIDTDLAAHRRLPHRQAGARHRRRRLDRLASCAARSTASRPAELVMLDRDESALHAVQLSIEGRALLDDRNLVVADIRDRERARRGVRASTGPRSCSTPPRSSTCRCSRCTPSEARQDQRVGHPARARRWPLEHGVERFVNISTDKAADPISVLGYYQADRRAAHRRAPRQRPSGTYSQRAVRQRARQPGLGARPPSAPRSRPAARSPSPTPTSPATS